MKCPQCHSTQIAKNGIVVADNTTSASSVLVNSLSPTVLGLTPTMSSNCASKCISMAWGCAASNESPRFITPLSCTLIREAGHQLSDAPEAEEIPEVSDLDELQTFVGNKHNKIWIWTAVNHFQAGILAWVIGDSPSATLRGRSAATFESLWLIVKCWQCFFYVTDGCTVYLMFINAGDQMISKTYMTRLESANTRLRHYARTIAPQDPVLFQVCP